MQQFPLGVTTQNEIGILKPMKEQQTSGPKYAEFAQRLVQGMRRAGVSQTDIAEEIRGKTEIKSARERVRLWMRGLNMPKDRELRVVSKMIGVKEADLRYGKEKPVSLPHMQGEHVTDEDELALLRAYRGLKKEWARNALRARAVELLEEFGEKGTANPWGNGSTQ